MTIQDDLQDMFHSLITAAPLDTVELYLHKLYPNLSLNEVKNALNRACLDLQMNYNREQNYVSMYKGPDYSSKHHEYQARAFRGAVELMDDSQQIMRVMPPFLYGVINGNKFYEVCYIPIGSETASSIAVGERPVPKEDRPFVRRIAIVPYGSDLKCIRRVGFSSIARINDFNEVEVLEKRGQDEAWLDMPDENQVY